MFFILLTVLDEICKSIEANKPIEKENSSGVACKVKCNFNFRCR